MKITLFTADEANRALGKVRPLVEDLVRLHRGIAAIDRRIEVMTLALAGASGNNPDAAESRGLVERRAALAREAREKLLALHDMGCVVKDLDMGLVDFYALAGDRLVFLCWRLGEEEVAHWHPLDGGFATRQPLDRSERG